MRDAGRTANDGSVTGHIGYWLGDKSMGDATLIIGA